VSVLAVIPARGGSKGIPRKNLAPLGGRPLIAYTLDAARAATTVTDILVTTDDNEIAAACEAEGVPVPYRRPEALATDSAGMAETVLHALDWWTKEHKRPELIVLLQPTSPLRSPADIDGTVEALRAARVESAISVHEMDEHPMECLRMTAGSWALIERAPLGAKGRQDYGARYYFINGAVYVVTPDFLRTRHAFMTEGAGTALYVMDRMRGLDIDDAEDLDMAEAILNHPRLGRRVDVRVAS
jgi:CMP-N,N'-diacetyllegionaminic acid synthase